MRVYLYQSAYLTDQNGKHLDQMLSDLGAHKVERAEDGSLDFSKIEAVIVNGNEDMVAASYVVAMAVAKQKPILFLLQKGSQIPNVITDFRNDKKTKKLFQLEFYTPENLARKIETFIFSAEGGVKEVPSIKFTLRITPSMERYLQWKSKQTGISKADFLRHQLTQSAKSDKDFQA